jgi:hypothetical protein
VRPVTIVTSPIALIRAGSLAALALFPAASVADAPAIDSTLKDTLLAVGLVLPVIALVIGAFLYMRNLRSSYEQACRNAGRLELFRESPAGLPAGSIGAVVGFVAAALLLYLLVVVIIGFMLSDLPGSIVGTITQSGTKALAGTAAIMFLIVIAAGALFYMQRLQKRFFDACREDRQLQLFFESPAGLPSGTVRAVLALIIVVVSLFLIAMQFFGAAELDAGVPEALTTLLGAVVAFYFATRVSQTAGDGAAQSQIESFKAQRDEALRSAETEQADTRLGKLRKGLAVVTAASSLLPKAVREKYVPVVEKIQTGLRTAENLLGSDNPEGAREVAAGAFDDFARNNPVVAVLSKAKDSFAPVLSTLGMTAAPVAIALAVVGIGVRLGGAKYQRWKQRILHAPLLPDTVALTAVDATIGDSLLRANPVLAAAYKPELEAGNRKFIKDAANALLTLDMDSLWAHYRRDETGNERFESRQQLEDAVEAFRRVKADFDLRPEVPADLLTAFGGYDQLLSAVDAIHEHPEAQADLDELMTISDGLMQQGQPVMKILENAAKEVEK